MKKNFNRREFLRGAAVTGVALMMPGFIPLHAESLKKLVSEKPPQYTSWDDLYRQQWTWDKVVRSTHSVNCWYQGTCSWDVYVKDGVVFREEQAAEYEPVNDELPDYNPRGCQKGGCMSERMYDPTRLKYPLKRVGERGSGKWERISWEQALSEIADTYLDVTLTEGTDRTIWDLGPSADYGVSVAGLLRFCNLTRSVCLDMNTEIGDSHRGANECFGTIIGSPSADDYFYSDLILMWGSNPFYTQIPNAHFFTEARYRGAKLITITPDYNPSSIHSDLWVPIKAGADAALALAIAHILVAEDKIKHDFVKEQTDLPLLVRSDTGAFLLESDVKRDGSDKHQMVIDENNDELAPAPRKSLDLNGLSPTLEVRKTITLSDGRDIEVRSVFSLLRERLDDYTPEKASEMCGVSVDMIRQLANEIAQAKAMANTTTSSLSKLYHGNLIERATILLFALTGNLGHKGASYSMFPMLTTDGLETFSSLTPERPYEKFAGEIEGFFEHRMSEGHTREDAIYEVANSMFKPGSGLPTITPSTIFWTVHGGVGDLAKQEWDPYLKQPVKNYLDDALKKDIMPLIPERGRTPRIMITLASNTLRRIRGGKQVLDTLWPKLRAHVVMDYRMNSTTQHADYVLPVASHYERHTHRMVTPLSPYLHQTQAAVEPFGESKPDWEIITLLTKQIQKKSQERGIEAFENHFGEKVNLQSLYDDFTMNGEYAEKDEKEVLKAIIDMSTNLDDFDHEGIKTKGFSRYTGIGDGSFCVGNACEVPADDSITPYTYHTRDKIPWATETRRIQFYMDHPLYHEFDEALPRHKEPPIIGGDYPLIMTGGKPRESIHSSWRDSRLMLRLTRGEPFILISAQDAEQRNISDNDWVRVFNDVGYYVARAKPIPSLPVGVSLIYAAWENYQFPEGSLRDVTPTPMNPVELASDYSHLKPIFGWGTPGFFDRETRVDIELWENAS